MPLYRTSAPGPAGEVEIVPIGPAPEYQFFELDPSRRTLRRQSWWEGSLRELWQGNPRAVLRRASYRWRWWVARRHRWGISCTRVLR